MIQPQTFAFLSGLAQHNEKSWFDAHKNDYLAAKADMEALAQALLEGLAETDAIEQFHLYRIYRDVRFSKDKTPYKTYFSGYFSRATAWRRGSYWLKVEPGATVVGGGFYGPSKEDLFRIRKEFEQDERGIREVLEAPAFAEAFGTLQGEALRTAPKGFDKAHPNIDLIRMKQFYAFHTFSDEEVLSADFVPKAVGILQCIRPFFDYMSSVLTTDLNGEPLDL